MSCNPNIYQKQLFGESIKQELSINIADKVITHRNNFRNMIRGKYFELLPLCLGYKNVKNKALTIDFLKLEVALRTNINLPVIARAKNGHFYFCGYTSNWMNLDNPQNIINSVRLTHNDITFIMDREMFPEKMLQISDYDDCQTGDFVVLKNKVVQMTTDLQTIDHYCDVLAEIEVTRFSLVMQARANTIFYGEEDDLTTNQFIANIFNGTPYTKVSGDFDIQDNTYTFDNTSLAQNLTESKREYQNRISELNSMIGINSLGVDKTSGVSDVEAKSNSAFITPIANSYIEARQQPLIQLFRRFPNEMDLIEVQYNDEVISEIMLKGGVNNGKSNNDTSRNDS